MIGRILRIGVVAIALASSSALTVSATPPAAEAAIEMSYTALFRQGLLRGFEAEWLLDPTLSEMILTDFDTDRNGVFDRHELIELNKASLPTLHENGFFMELFSGDEAVPIVAVSGIKATAENRQVRYRFALGLASGDRDLRKAEIVASLYDPTQLTIIHPAMTNAASLGEGAPAGCYAHVDESPNIVRQQRGRGALFGAVHGIQKITTIKLACEKEKESKEKG